jgi:DNA repair ATPase RecN
MEKNTEIKKTNTQLLKEIQDVVDNIDKEKEEIEKRLNIIDILERKPNVIDSINKEKEEVDKSLQIINVLEQKYYDLTEEVKNNSKK